MKRRTLLSALAAGAATSVVAGSPATAAPVSADRPKRVRRDIAMASDMLGIDVRYSVYLPPGYFDADRRTTTYPVLYLLHGLGAINTEWLDLGEAPRILDEEIAAGRIPPMVVVMPEARRDPTVPGGDQPAVYYMNAADGSFPYADMFLQEFVPHIERRFRAGRSAARRGIGGLSMGGFGALSFAMQYPGNFAGAFSMSTGIRTEEQLLGLDMSGWNHRFGMSWGFDLSGADRLNERYRHWSLVDTIERTPLATLEKSAYYLDCGSYDPFFEANADLHVAMTKKGVDHRFMAREGTHDWDYWRSGLPGCLSFFADQVDQA